MPKTTTTTTRRTAVGLLAASLPLAGCMYEDEGIWCTASHEPGILIRVVDSATGAPTSCGARAVITADGYAEVVENPFSGSPSCDDGLPLAGAHERAGTYAVTVTKTGYYDFTRTDIVVNAGECHVNTVTVQANLDPRP
jgi:hypothetical protein